MASLCLTQTHDRLRNALSCHLPHTYCLVVSNQKFMSNADIVDPVMGIINNMLQCPEAKAEFERLGILKRVCTTAFCFHCLSDHYISSRIIQM